MHPHKHYLHSNHHKMFELSDISLCIGIFSFVLGPHKEVTRVYFWQGSEYHRSARNWTLIDCMQGLLSVWSLQPWKIFFLILNYMSFIYSLFVFWRGRFNSIQSVCLCAARLLLLCSYMVPSIVLRSTEYTLNPGYLSDLPFPSL